MAKQRFHYGWVVIFTGLLVTIGAHGFGRMSYTLILPAMKDGLHFSYTELGLLEMGNFVGYLFMAIVGGLLAARFGPRRVIALALVLMSLTLAGMGLVHSFGFALAMRTLTGIGNGAAYVPATALAYAVLAFAYVVYALAPVKAGLYLSAVVFGLSAWSVPTITAAAAGDYVGARLAPACLGFITLFFGIGQALGPVVGGYLADRTHSFTTSFIVACGVSLLGAILATRLPRNEAEETSQ